MVIWLDEYALVCDGPPPEKGCHVERASDRSLFQALRSAQTRKRSLGNNLMSNPRSETTVDGTGQSHVRKRGHVQPPHGYVCERGFDMSRLGPPPEKGCHVERASDRSLFQALRSAQTRKITGSSSRPRWGGVGTGEGQTW
jgi:hypothetical protein